VPKGKSALFDPLVSLEKRHPAFERIRTQPASIGGRTMMAEVFEIFDDKDGNFVRDFQTAGFDARVFELYLHAYFTDSGYTIDATHQRPDFMVERHGVRVAVEATTSSRPDPFLVEELLEPTSDEVARKQRDEMPVRLGSPLFSKLQKRYWELPHVAGLPFVIAIEAFHDTTSLFYPGGVLGNYLYGLEHFPTFTEDGQLLIGTTPIESHERPGKTPIPSNFFAQPGAEHVSAILFSNSGTYSKFNRRGFLAGHQRGDLTIIRTGTCWDPDPNAAAPLPFQYEIRQRPTLEPWGEGLEVFHNPNALVPLPRKFFRNAADSVLTTEKKMSSLVPDFHPFMSHSICLRNSSIPLVHEIDGITIDLLTEREFNDLKPITEEEAMFMENFAEEVEWLGDRNRGYIASILRDFADDDWNAVVLARDPAGMFRPVEILCDFPDRAAARGAAVRAIAAHAKAETMALA
jgi:hypothetical protein